MKPSPAGLPAGGPGAGRPPSLLLALLLAALAAAPRPAGAAILFLEEEPEVYAAVDRLSASGAFRGFMTGTRPYDVRAVHAAAVRALAATPPLGAFDMELLRWLAAYTAPARMGRATVGAGYAETGFVPQNADGIPVPPEWSARVSLAAREEVSPNASGHIRWSGVWGEAGYWETYLLESALEIGTKAASLQGGMINAWYGPGRHGSLVLSNNARPFPGVRLHDREPIPVRGFFSFLGSVQYDFFLGWMEEREGIGRTMLVGTRLAARPSPLLEVGLSRALHYAGPGYGCGFSEFIEDFFGSNTPADRSNTVGGIDVTLDVPWRLQPFQVYWAPAGEHSRLVEWANQVGLYLPRVVGLPRLELRAEYADTYRQDAKDIAWYDTSSVYPHRYKGEILGHPLGAASRDWFYGARWNLRPGSSVEASYEHLQHNDPDRRGERHDVLAAQVSGWIAPEWRAQVGAAADRTTFAGGAAGENRTDLAVQVAITWQGEGAVPPPEGAR